MYFLTDARFRATLCTSKGGRQTFSYDISVITFFMKPLGLSSCCLTPLSSRREKHLLINIMAFFHSMPLSF